MLEMLVKFVLSRTYCDVGYSYSEVKSSMVEEGSVGGDFVRSGDHETRTRRHQGQLATIL